MHKGDNHGSGYGGGHNRMGGMGLGAGGNCVCPSCGTTVAHQRGVPCYQMTCPKCGARMTRQYENNDIIRDSNKEKKEFVNKVEKNKKIKVKINESLCIGCGICVNICPDAFEMGNNGIALVRSSNSANQDCIEKAARSCPKRAIILE